MPLVEADVHLFRGRLEIRHLKTAGPLPILWDRWRLAPPWEPRLLLEELLEAALPSTWLMLDLKGSDPALPARVERALARRAGPIAVCSQSWELLEPFRALDGVCAIHSVGGRRGLEALRRRFAGETLAGISIHRKLLDAATVADLRERASLILSWPVATVHEALLLAGWGVDGLITERFETIAPALSSELPVAA